MRRARAGVYEVTERVELRGRLGCVVEFFDERAAERPDPVRELVDGDARRPTADCAGEQTFVGVAQRNWARRSDCVEGMPDGVGTIEVPDLVEETVSARPGDLDRAAVRGDGYPVEAFGHCRESRKS
jgi:hypothetical protein